MADETGLTRRRFLEIAAGAVAAGIAGTLAGCEDTLRGNFGRVNAAAVGLTTGRQRIAAFAALGPTPVAFPAMTADGGEKVYAYTQGSEVVVISTLCTHRGCTVAWAAASERFECPCHAGFFDKAGNVISGPPLAPLAKYPAELVAGDVFIQG